VDIVAGKMRLCQAVSQEEDPRRLEAEDTQVETLNEGASVNEPRDYIPDVVRGEFETSEPVDLVFYGSDGARHVIGKAGINSDGMMTAEVTTEVDPEVLKMLSVVKGEFSFGLPRRMMRPYIRSRFQEIEDTIAGSFAEIEGDDSQALYFKRVPRSLH
jgi:hypothetical protein